MKTRRMLFTLVFLFLFTGCGTATAIGSSTSVQPTVLHVIRPATLNNVPRFERTIRDVAAVQRLYNSANALPTQPVFNGPVSCPADLAITYQLSFLHGTTLVQNMYVFPTGCRYVQIGQRTSHTRFLNDGFSMLAAKTIGLSSLVPTIG